MPNVPSGIPLNRKVAATVLLHRLLPDALPLLSAGVGGYSYQATLQLASPFAGVQIGSAGTSSLKNTCHSEVMHGVTFLPYEFQHPSCRGVLHCQMHIDRYSFAIAWRIDVNIFNKRCPSASEQSQSGTCNWEYTISWWLSNGSKVLPSSLRSCSPAHNLSWITWHSVTNGVLACKGSIWRIPSRTSFHCLGRPNLGLGFKGCIESCHVNSCDGLATVDRGVKQRTAANI